MYVKKGNTIVCLIEDVDVLAIEPLHKVLNTSFPCNWKKNEYNYIFIYLNLTLRWVVKFDDAFAESDIGVSLV